MQDELSIEKLEKEIANQQIMALEETHHSEEVKITKLSDQLKDVVAKHN